MKNRSVVLLLSGIVLSFPVGLVSAQPPDTPPSDDSLTAVLCNNQEQIFSRRTGDFRIDYYMGDVQLNMKTMTGFLSLNSASEPIYRQFRRHRIAGIAMMIGGIGLVVADGYVAQPSFPLITLTGIATSIWGIGVFVGANDKFRLAIHAYNKDICRIK